MFSAQTEVEVKCFAKCGLKLNDNNSVETVIESADIHEDTRSHQIVGLLKSVESQPLLMIYTGDMQAQQLQI